MGASVDPDHNRFNSDSDTDEEIENLTSAADAHPVDSTENDPGNHADSVGAKDSKNHDNAYTAATRDAAPTSLILWIQPFLAFYNRYTNAEDTIFELLLASSDNGSVDGNMRSMLVQCADMHVTMRHSALATENIILVKNMSFEMLKFRLNRLGDRILTYNKSIIEAESNYYKACVHSEIPNNEKEINISVDAVAFPQNINAPLLFPDETEHTPHSQLRTAFVKGVTLRKILKVHNTHPYLDNDSQVVQVDQVNFRGLNVMQLHWLFMLQDLSNKLPNSRFAHPKASTMDISVATIVFGTEPDADDSAYIVSPPSANPAASSNSKDKTLKKGTASATASTSQASTLETADSNESYAGHGYGEQDYSFGKSKWLPRTTLTEQLGEEAYATLTDYMDKCATFTLKGMHVVMKKIPFDIFSEMSIDIKAFEIEVDILATQIAYYHRVFCIDAEDIQGARVIPTPSGGVGKKDKQRRQSATGSGGAGGDSETEIGPERVGAHFSFTEFAARFLLGPDIKMRSVTMQSAAVDMFSKFDGFRHKRVIGEHEASTEDYARRMCFLRTDDFGIIWHPGHPAADKPSIMHYRANLRTVTMDASTGSIIRFFCAFQALLRMTDRITAVNNRIGALDLEATAISARARVSRRRERRLQHVSKLSSSEPSAAAAAPAEGSYPWDPISAPNMRIEVARFLLNYCTETPNAPPTVVKTINTVCDGVNVEADTETGADSKEEKVDMGVHAAAETDIESAAQHVDATLTEKNEHRYNALNEKNQRYLRAYQRAVQLAQMPKHLRSTTRMAPSSKLSAKESVDGSGSEKKKKQQTVTMAYSSVLTQLSQVSLMEYSTHAGNLMDPVKHGVRQKIDANSVMAQVHQIHRSLREHSSVEKSKLRGPGVPKLKFQKTSNSNIVSHTETTSATAVQDFRTLVHSRKKNSSGKMAETASAKSPLSRFSSKETLSPIDLLGIQGTPERSKGNEEDTLLAAHSMAHVHNGSPYLHPQNKSRIQRKFFLESSVSRDHMLLRKQAAMKQEETAAIAQFEPSRLSATLHTLESGKVSLIADRASSPATTASEVPMFAYASPKSGSFAQNAAFYTFDEFTPTKPVDEAHHFDGLTLTPSSPDKGANSPEPVKDIKYVVHLSNFQAHELVDKSTLAEDQDPFLVFTWGYYEIHNETETPVVSPVRSQEGEKDSAVPGRAKFPKPVPNSSNKHSSASVAASAAFNAAFGVDESDVESEAPLQHIVWVELGRYETAAVQGANTQCVFPSDEKFHLVLDRNPLSSGEGAALSSSSSDSSSSDYATSDEDSSSSEDSSGTPAGDASTDLASNRQSVRFDAAPISRPGASRGSGLGFHAAGLVGNRAAAAEGAGAGAGAGAVSETHREFLQKMASCAPVLPNGVQYSDYELRVQVMHRSKAAGTCTLGEARVAFGDYILSEKRYYHFDLKLSTLRPGCQWPVIGTQQGVVGLTGFIVKMDEENIKQLNAAHPTKNMSRKNSRSSIDSTGGFNADIELDGEDEANSDADTVNSDSTLDDENEVQKKRPSSNRSSKMRSSSEKSKIKTDVETVEDEDEKEEHDSESDSEEEEREDADDEDVVAALLAEELKKTPFDSISVEAAGEGGEDADMLYLEDLDHGGLYLNLEFSHFVYRSCPDLHPAGLDPFFLQSAEDLLQAELKQSFNIQQGINTVQAAHLPTKEVEYSWKDCQLHLNNITTKPVLRIRGFAYITTTKNVDLTSMAHAKEKHAAAERASGTKVPPTAQASDRTFDTETPAPKADKGNAYAHVHAADVTLQGLSRDESAFTSSRYAHDRIAPTPVHGTHKKNHLHGHGHDHIVAEDANGSDSDGSMRSARDKAEKMGKSRQKHHRKHHAAKDNESPADAVSTIQKLDDITLDVNSLEIGLTPNTAIGHQLDVMLRQIGLFFQALRDPIVTNGESGNAGSAERNPNKAGSAAGTPAAAPALGETLEQAKCTRDAAIALLREPRKLYIWTTNIKNFFCGLDAECGNYLDPFHMAVGEGTTAHHGHGTSFTEDHCDSESDQDNPDSTKNNRAKSNRFTFEDIHGLKGSRRRQPFTDKSKYHRPRSPSVRKAALQKSLRPPPLTARPTGDSHDDKHLVRDFLSLTMIDMHIVCDASASDEAVYADILALDMGPLMHTDAQKPESASTSAASEAQTAYSTHANTGESLSNQVLKSVDTSALSEVPIHRDAMGGIFSFEIAQAVLAFKPMEQDPLLLVDHLAIQGPLYMAKIGNPSVNFLWEHYALSESLPLVPHRAHMRHFPRHVDEHAAKEHQDAMPTFDNAHTNRDTDAGVDNESYAVEVLDPLEMCYHHYLGTSCVRADAPNKFYLELKLSSALIYVRLHNVTSKLWSHVSDSIDSLLIPDDPLVPLSPPLNTLDVLRYKTHGSLVLTIDKIIIEKVHETAVVSRSRQDEHNNSGKSNSSKGSPQTKYADMRSGSFTHNTWSQTQNEDKHGNNKIKWRFAIDHFCSCFDHKQLELCSRDFDFTCDYDVQVLRRASRTSERRSARTSIHSTGPVAMDTHGHVHRMSASSKVPHEARERENTEKQSDTTSEETKVTNYDYTYVSDSDSDEAEAGEVKNPAAGCQKTARKQYSPLEESMKRHPYHARGSFSHRRRPAKIRGSLDIRDPTRHLEFGATHHGGKSHLRSRRDGGSRARDKFVPVTIVGRLLHIPGILLTFHHKRAIGLSRYFDSGVLRSVDNTNSEKRQFVYHHHDVYLRPVVPMLDTNALIVQHSKNLTDNSLTGVAHSPYTGLDAPSDGDTSAISDNSFNYFGDKFELFRSEPASIDWDIEVVLLDSPDAPVTINLRLDLLYRVLDPFLHPDDYEVPDGIDEDAEAESGAETETEEEAETEAEAEQRAKEAAELKGKKGELESESSSSESEDERTSSKLGASTDDTADNTEVHASPQRDSHRESRSASWFISSKPDTAEDLEMLLNRDPLLERPSLYDMEEAEDAILPVESSETHHLSEALVIEVSPTQQTRKGPKAPKGPKLRLVTTLSATNTIHMYPPAFPQKKAQDIAFMEIVRQLNLQVHIKKILIFSWQSATNCNGFAYVQDRFNLDLKMKRSAAQRVQVPKSFADTVRSSHVWAVEPPEVVVLPLRIEHMISEIDFADLYVRDWSVKATAPEPEKHKHHVRRHGSKQNLRTHTASVNNAPGTAPLKPSLLSNATNPLLQDAMFTENRDLLESENPMLRSHAANTNSTRGKNVPNKHEIVANAKESAEEKEKKSNLAETVFSSFAGFGAAIGSNLSKGIDTVISTATTSVQTGAHIVSSGTKVVANGISKSIDGITGGLDAVLDATGIRGSKHNELHTAAVISNLESKIRRHIRSSRRVTGLQEEMENCEYVERGAEEFVFNRMQALHSPGHDWVPSRVHFHGRYDATTIMKQFSSPTVDGFFISLDSRLMYHKRRAEPASLQEMEALFVPICLIAHTSKIEVSLTEGNDKKSAGNREISNLGITGSGKWDEVIDYKRKSGRTQFDRMNIKRFKVGADSMNPLMVCPRQGTMGGLCVAAKRNDKVRTVASILGGKPTKRRWYELDSDCNLKWYLGRDRKQDTTSGYFNVASVIDIRAVCTNPDVRRVCPYYSFEVQTEHRVFEFGCDSVFEYENWLLALRVAYRKTHGKDIILIPLTRLLNLREMNHKEELAKAEEGARIAMEAMAAAAAGATSYKSHNPKNVPKTPTGSFLHAPLKTQGAQVSISVANAYERALDDSQSYLRAVTARPISFDGRHLPSDVQSTAQLGSTYVDNAVAATVAATEDTVVRDAFGHAISNNSRIKAPNSRGNIFKRAGHRILKRVQSGIKRDEAGIRKKNTTSSAATSTQEGFLPFEGNGSKGSNAAALGSDNRLSTDGKASYYDARGSLESRESIFHAWGEVGTDGMKSDSLHSSQDAPAPGSSWQGRLAPIGNDGDDDDDYGAISSSSVNEIFKGLEDQKMASSSSTTSHSSPRPLSSRLSTTSFVSCDSGDSADDDDTSFPVASPPFQHPTSTGSKDSRYTDIPTLTRSNSDQGGLKFKQRSLMHVDDLEIGKTLVSSNSFRLARSDSFTVPPQVDPNSPLKASDRSLSGSHRNGSLDTKGQSRRYSFSMKNMLQQSVVIYEGGGVSTILPGDASASQMEPSSDPVSVAPSAVEAPKPIVIAASSRTAYVPVLSDHFGNVFHARGPQFRLLGLQNTEKAWSNTSPGGIGTQNKPQDDAFGDKIWGLRVVDLRLLWTIDIRDIVYAYLNRIFDLQTMAEVRDESRIVRKRAQSISSADAGDVLDVPALSEDHTPNVSQLKREYTARGQMKSTPLRGRGTFGAGKKAIDAKGGFYSAGGGGNVSLNDYFRLKPQPVVVQRDQFFRSSGGGLTIPPRRNRKTSKTYKAFESRQIAAVPSPPATAQNSPSANLAELSLPDNSGQSSPSSPPLLDSPTSPGGTRKSKSVSFSEEPTGAISMMAESAMQRSERTPNATEYKAKRHVSIHRGSPEGGGAKKALAAGGTSKRSSLSGGIGTKFKARASITKTIEETEAAAKRLPKRFFFVELVDPQLNFLDAKNHGSIVTVAAHSTLEGFRSGIGVQPEQTVCAYDVDIADLLPDERMDPRLNSQLPSAKPKRKIELNFRMNAVSAFTVDTKIKTAGSIKASAKATGSASSQGVATPSKSADVDENVSYAASVFENGVFWNLMHNTNIHAGAQGSAFMHGCESSSEDGSAESSIPDEKAEEDMRNSVAGYQGTGFLRQRYQSTPATCKVETRLKRAITDFDIKASYSFFLDLSREDMQFVDIDPGGDLSSDFTLDLQKFEMDLDGPQFFIITDVTRNVLLEPPPKLRKKNKKNASGEEAVAPSSSSTPGPATTTPVQNEPPDRSAVKAPNGNVNDTSPAQVAFKPAEPEAKAKTKARAEEAKAEAEEAEAEVKAGTEAEAEAEAEASTRNSIKANRDKIDFNKKLLLRENIKITPAELRAMKKLTSQAKNAVRVLVENALGQPLEREAGTERDVRVTIGEGTWVLRTDDDAETVTTSFTGVEANFKYHDNRQMETFFTVQRFSVKRSDLQQGTENWVIQPVVEDMEPCLRCHRNFKMEENYSEACGIHESPSGERGVYRAVKVHGDTADAAPLEDGMDEVMMWSCCGRQHIDAPPCSFKHHQFKEKMLQINALANPKTAVENVDVTVLTELDISVFAGSDYDLKMQISKGLTTVFYSYFNLGVPIEAEEDVADSEDEATHNIVDSSKPLNMSASKNSTEYNLKSVHFGDSKSGTSSGAAGLGSIARHQLLELDPEYATPDTDELIRGGVNASHIGRYDSAGFPNINARHGTVSSKNGLPAEMESSVSALKPATPKKSFLGYFSRSPAIAKSSTKSKHVRIPTKGALQIETSKSLDIASFPDARGQSLAASTGTQPKESAGVGSEVKGSENDISDANDAAETSVPNYGAAIVTADVRHEIVYVRRLRMGALKASINTSGFTFNVTNLRAEIDSLTIHGEALEWQQLMNRLLFHAAWSVARHAKTSTIVASLFTWSSTVPVGPTIIDHEGSGSDSEEERSSDSEKERSRHASMDLGIKVGAEEGEGADGEDTRGALAGNVAAGSDHQKDGNSRANATFMSIPIPFSSHWAAKQGAAENQKPAKIINSSSSATMTPTDSADGLQPPPPAGWAPNVPTKASRRRTSPHDKEEVSTTPVANNAHRKEMAKLMGKWKR